MIDTLLNGLNFVLGPLFDQNIPRYAFSRGCRQEQQAAKGKLVRWTLLYQCVALMFLVGCYVLAMLALFR
ncbi:MAG: hypothetical protein GAK31_00291 [Stenotrophomonas maltophilia]|uniref:Transmembrane protein n=1 Tax=Stenotrophomonas maltophilia TaxID=40324 RepID=A0A7V8FJA8_STEMA|nr:MAG: hypothetical protein GAK31_00291 [Stenotrophomonas maltophilia]